ncbi:YdcF family protein [Chlorogloeopsis sp. ULAP02]|uniref:YdcF family protein n=1 Tax=Chlorogloeopsis sp. ULAP02 TaxID=3107926 RepID=UPI003135A7E8
MHRKIQPRQKKFPVFRLFKRQQMWMLTVPGWGIFMTLVASLIGFTFVNIHPFLAVTSPVKADILVVEGWIPDYALVQALAEFKKNSYRLLIITGTPLERGFYLAEYKNYAALAAATLQKLGLEPEKIIVVSSQEVTKDRTYASAIALQQWLVNADLKLEAINIFTHATHARRSWLIFQQALVPKIKVGVIASSPQNYEPSKWWMYSTGVRSVINEVVAYIYALVVSWKA